jgi:hypothetical protein
MSRRLASGPTASRSRSIAAGLARWVQDADPEIGTGGDKAARCPVLRLLERYLVVERQEA